MEIKINKEISDYHETIFFGLSARQFFCSLSAVGVAVGIYFLFGHMLGKEITSWLCMICAVPLAAAGFFNYNGMTFEKFIWAVFKTKVLYAERRLYRSENEIDQLLKEPDKKMKRRIRHHAKRSTKAKG